MSDSKKFKFLVATIDGGGVESPLTDLAIFTRHTTEFSATRAARAGHDSDDAPSKDEHRALVAAVAPRRLIAAYWHERTAGWDLVLEEVPS